MVRLWVPETRHTPVDLPLPPQLPTDTMVADRAGLVRLPPRLQPALVRGVTEDATLFKGRHANGYTVPLTWCDGVRIRAGRSTSAPG